VSALFAPQWDEVVGYDPLAGKAYQHTGLGAPLADYLASKKNAQRAGNTLRDKEVYIGSFALMFPRKRLADITPIDVMHWEAEAGVGASSLRTRRSHLNDFFEWCVRWELVDRNPLAKLEPVKIKKGRVYDIFNDAEVQALCGLPLIDGALLMVMLDEGLRRSECVALQPRHIQPEPEPGQLTILSGKGNRDRLVPLTRRTATALALLRGESMMDDKEFFWYTRVNQGRTIKRHRPLGDGSFSYWWKRVLSDAGVRYRNPHMTRHSFATRWLRRGGRLETLSLVMGHASVATTMDLYGHLDTRDVFADLAIMEQLDA